MPKSVPWIEKYRPKKLEDVIYQDDTINMFKNSIQTNNLPHMLLYGPPGTGKTTSILIIANILFGPHKVRERVMELNASDDRGINVVRNKIMNFAKENLGTADPDYPSPPFKIIILDEADSMTKEAQSALKKIIETNSKTTRFCLICNYISKIIDPIQSRCSKMRFKPIKPVLMVDRLAFIASNENLDISKECVEIITKNCDGDMRKAIMYLQNMKYLNVLYKNITTANVYDATNNIDPNIVSNVLKKCFSKEETLDAVVHDVKELWKNGYVLTSILETTMFLIVDSKLINDKQKESIAFHIASVDRMLINGANEYLQLLNVFSFIRATFMGIELFSSIDVL